MERTNGEGGAGDDPEEPGDGSRDRLRPTRLDGGIFLVSFAVLLIELLLTRIFSVVMLRSDQPSFSPPLGMGGAVTAVAGVRMASTSPILE